MTLQEQLNNWLTSGFSSANNFGEYFYYDRRDKEFFSIVAIDHFLVDEDFKVNETAISGYSSDTIHLLVDRMKRISEEDRSILAIPLAEDERDLQQQIDTFLNIHAISLSEATLWEPGEATLSFQIDQSDPIPPKPVSNNSVVNDGSHDQNQAKAFGLVAWIKQVYNRYSIKKNQKTNFTG